MAAAGCAHGRSADTAAAHGPFAGVPNVGIRYYSVSGTTPEEIRRSMEPQRPKDSWDGMAVDAVTRWTYSWSLPGDSSRCDPDQARVGFEALVILPRLANPEQVPPEVRQRWDAFVTSLEKHEAYHVRHAWENRGEVLKAIRASSCKSWNEAAQAAARRVAEQQRAYDVETRHGATEVVPFH